jgi:hypothetical protein
VKERERERERETGKRERETERESTRENRHAYITYIHTSNHTYIYKTLNIFPKFMTTCLPKSCSTLPCASYASPSSHFKLFVLSS